MSQPKNILVIRLSSLGDVLLTIPVLQEALSADPTIHLFIFTKKSNARIFSVLARTTVVEVDTTNTHKTALQLLALFHRTIRQNQISAVIDLHFVLRTMMLRVYSFFLGVPFFRIDKQRQQKRRFLKEPKSHQLKSAFDVYREAFLQANIKLQSNPTWKFAEKIVLSSNAKKLVEGEHKNCIAIAPFAHFTEKIYPPRLMGEVLDLLTQEKAIDKIFLLGKGAKEETQINVWREKSDKVISLSHIDLLQQMKVLSFCQVAVVMDSANMHLAGLAERPHTIAIFGATSERAGFSVWRNTTVLEKSPECHPCSIFGNKPCTQPSLFCMEAISPQEIVSLVLRRMG